MLNTILLDAGFDLSKIFIAEGKGRKDRFYPLPEKLSSCSAKPYVGQSTEPASL
jgi:hypothetical protein